MGQYNAKRLKMNGPHSLFMVCSTVSPMEWTKKGKWRICSLQFLATVIATCVHLCLSYFYKYIL